MYMKSLLKIFAAILFLFAGMATNASAANVDMSGYAWGADSSPFGGVGWINFNNTSTGSNTAGSPSTEYKVEFNQTTWELTGYAWSERYGYIKFGDSNSTFDLDEYPSDKTTCVTNPKNTSSYGPCNVHVVDLGNNGGFQLVGYARFCFVYASGCSGTLKPNSELGGYDGWIAFKTSIGAVSYTPNGNSQGFHGYAWGGGSSSSSSSDYGEGAGWIRMDPNNVASIKCVNGSNNIDCLNADGPIVELYTTLNSGTKTGKVAIRRNTDVTLKWDITNLTSTCTPVTSSSPANSTWDSYTPTGADIASGEKTITGVTESTTFTLSCTESGKKGSDDQIVEIDALKPVIDMSATQATFDYTQTADIKYSISNIPDGCKATLVNKNTNTAIFSNIDIDNNGGDPATVVSGTQAVTGLLGNPVVFELTCTPPSPHIPGDGSASLRPDETTVIDFSVTDKTTNITNSSYIATGVIPCTNTGLDMNTSIKGVVIGSCKATTNGVSNISPWNNSISWSQTEETNYPTITTKTISAITQIGDSSSPILYQIQCTPLSAATSTSKIVKAIKMSRSCTPASLTMSAPTCVQPGQDFNITYTGSGIQSNTCKKSGSGGFGGTISGGNPFTTTYTPIFSTTTSTWSDGQTKTYTIDSCVDASNPNGTPLTETISIDVKTSCTSSLPPCTPTSRKACPGTGTNTGPIFKEF